MPTHKPEELQEVLHYQFKNPALLRIALTHTSYANEPSDPLSRDIYSRVHEGTAFNASAIVPNDHWAVLGAAMQKYLASRSDRAELIDSIVAYWDEQQ